MASAHYTYLTPLVELPEAQKFITAVAVGGALVLIGKMLTMRLRSSAGVEQAIVPDSKITAFGFFDFFVEAFVNYHDSILGRAGRKYLPFTASIFTFILFSNLLGMIPGMPAITTTVWVTAGIALCSFIYFNWQGVKEHGIVGYLKHFAGPIWWFAPFLFALEVLVTVPLRVVTLNLRLYWNITADHVVLESITRMLGSGAARVLTVIFYGLGTFVCFMQAFIFTTLTMVYVLLATQHEEH